MVTLAIWLRLKSFLGNYQNIHFCPHFVDLQAMSGRTSEWHAWGTGSSETNIAPDINNHRFFCHYPIIIILFLLQHMIHLAGAKIIRHTWRSWPRRSKTGAALTLHPVWKGNKSFTWKISIELQRRQKLRKRPKLLTRIGDAQKNCFSCAHKLKAFLEFIKRVATSIVWCAMFLWIVS